MFSSYDRQTKNKILNIEVKKYLRISHFSVGCSATFFQKSKTDNIRFFNFLRNALGSFNIPKVKHKH